MNTLGLSVGDRVRHENDSGHFGTIISFEEFESIESMNTKYTVAMIDWDSPVQFAGTYEYTIDKVDTLVLVDSDEFDDLDDLESEEYNDEYYTVQIGFTNHHRDDIFLRDIYNIEVDQLNNMIYLEDKNGALSVFTLKNDLYMISKLQIEDDEEDED